MNFFKTKPTDDTGRVDFFQILDDIEAHEGVINYVKVDDDYLLWENNSGIGHYPVKLNETPYDSDYFHKYQLYEIDGTNAINEARLDLIEKYTSKNSVIVDVGIGCGTFVNGLIRRGFLYPHGNDVNDDAIFWLKKRGIFHDFHSSSAKINVATFWDSLEHIPGPDMKRILSQVTDLALISCPIYASFDHLKSSKHLRTDEHIHYWSHDGLILLMDGMGFELDAYNFMESELGREDIRTFVFRRTRVID